MNCCDGTRATPTLAGPLVGLIRTFTEFGYEAWHVDSASCNWSVSKRHFLVIARCAMYCDQKCHLTKQSPSMGVASLIEQARGIKFPTSATQPQLAQPQDQEEIGDNLAPVPSTLWIHFPFLLSFAANHNPFPQQCQKVLVHDEGMTH